MRIVLRILSSPFDCPTPCACGLGSRARRRTTDVFNLDLRKSRQRTLSVERNQTVAPLPWHYDSSPTVRGGSMGAYRASGSAPADI